ncbi:crotonase/enoyl-CoA hydratase family protein [Streptomyces sp. NPDC051636]|uniref:crotonase/enoyl-CoA hydratase family protein n=1 Tax=Streptomyces sp. NPDC051636 TaxID=3365663 RepID=UPI00379A5F77
MTLVSYQLDGPVALITMDDGKANAMSLQMITELNTALDRAEADGAVVLLSGREGIFSGGFDLPVLQAGGDDAIAMVEAGFELAIRALAFPRPLVIACTGHAVAMGVFLLLCGDYRVGASGSYKFTANEVAIGLTMPHAACEVLRQRLSPAYFNRAVTLAETFSPDNAVEAGFLDRVVDPGHLQTVARDVADATAGLDPNAHATSKLRARQHALNAIRAGLDADHAAVRGRA